ncbi:MAG: 3-phosphoshikimate 1-carboxyvinyltransferase [Candidatus Cyclonatronum sp.]|uniref:3-phosphoshikimate 1-carboxyvinyltransferase n=1 Tax=Cyclonatronum sp. TaxID=3024185 RepID=UPI0025BBF342|nr:3-phosphoshikimate 1-carboxyvinyltransferase [Cyclonatronum sp.]MCC5934132.1 3-phosphoshikimate 1-carboxyvinyltransferase [Balneolales bacterium]MCH8486249.1 3-phosphoshikimate 1-carboxyvinyltransferase [Cyclonatronum sp.]
MNKTVEPAKCLRGEITDLPADKSIAHRAALFATLARGESVIRNFSEAADPQSTLQCLRDLGVPVETDGNTIVIRAKGRKTFSPIKSEIDCGNSGTTMRLLSGMVAGAGLPVTLTGDASLSSRPMKRITEPLGLMGAEIETAEGNRAPILFRPHKGLHAIDYPLPMPSAQVKSCVLLAGLFADGETRVTEKLPSRDHTERMLGLEMDFNADGTRVLKSSREFEVRPQHLTVPNDISAAAFWMVAASVIPGSEIVLRGVGVNPSRSAVISILQRMGADIRVTLPPNMQASQAVGEPVADITIKSAQLRPVSLLETEIPNAIDEIPVLAVAMGFARGKSEVRNASELRAKECDRIAAVAEMLRKAGIKVVEYKDGFEVIGGGAGPCEPAEHASFHDHRIAMASSILALKGSGPSVITGADCTAISYPHFYRDLSLLAD